MNVQEKAICKSLKLDVSSSVSIGIGNDRITLVNQLSNVVLFLIKDDMLYTYILPKTILPTLPVNSIKSYLKINIEGLTQYIRNTEQLKI